MMRRSTVTLYPCALPLQVADEVTKLIEGPVQQLQEAKEVRSVSRAGESMVKIDIRLEFAKPQAALDRDEMDAKPTPRCENRGCLNTGARHGL